MQWSCNCFPEAKYIGQTRLSCCRHMGQHAADTTSSKPDIWKHFRNLKTCLSSLHVSSSNLYFALRFSLIQTYHRFWLSLYNIMLELIKDIFELKRFGLHPPSFLLEMRITLWVATIFSHGNQHQPSQTQLQSIKTTSTTTTKTIARSHLRFSLLGCEVVFTVTAFK